MKNISQDLKLPDINRSSRMAISLKDNYKNLIQKIKEKNIIKFERDIDITNHLKNLSRNNIKTTSKKQNDLTINPNPNEKKILNKIIFNNISPITNINKLHFNTKTSKNKESTLDNFDTEFKSSNLNPPNTISTTKNSYYISFYSKNGFINTNKNSNFALYKNKNIVNNSISSKSNNKTYISYNNDKSKINNYTQNNIKILTNKKSNKKLFDNQINTTIKNINNFNNLKFQLIMPKIMNGTNNSKKYQIYENIEENKVTKINKINFNNNNHDKYFISQPTMLKEIRNIENLNHINNFISILKQSILIEIELNELLTTNQTEQNMKKIINIYNTFFNQLDYITLEINIFLNKEYNALLQKILKLLIYYHCFIFMLLILNDGKNFSMNMKSKYYNILKKISFCLYNVFSKYIYRDLSCNKYKDLSFVNSLNNLFTINTDYIIKSTISYNDIFNIILKNYNSCLDLFIKILNNDKNENLEEMTISLKDLLLNINQKDLIYHIDICLNIFLYSILDKNLSKSKINSEKNKSNKNKALSLVPYLPPISKKNKYTIVLDIDETLGHFIHNEIDAKYFHNYGFIIENDKISFNTVGKDKKRVGFFLVRPYAKYFLEKIKNLFFEIVIFSAGTKDYCDKVLDILDLNNNLINYRLYRTHLSLRNINNDVKDLSLLGRDLSKLIMIDNFSENFKLQQDNGLPINSWVGDITDTSLRDIIPIMNYIVENNIEDVRTVVKKVKIQLNNFSENSYFYDKINLKF